MDDRGFKGSPCYVLLQYSYEGEVEVISNYVEYSLNHLVFGFWFLKTWADRKLGGMYYKMIPNLSYYAGGR